MERAKFWVVVEEEEEELEEELVVDDGWTFEDDVADNLVSAAIGAKDCTVVAWTHGNGATLGHKDIA